MIRTAVLLLAAAFLSAPLLAQAPTAKTQKLPTYDVVSIKIHDGDSDSWGINTDHNTFTARAVSVSFLFAFAWNIREDLISGITGPADKVRYDIEAKLLSSPGDASFIDASDEQLATMMQPVLIDRFHLKLHTESKIQPIYELVIARSGLKLKPRPPQDHPTDPLSLDFNYTNSYLQVTAKGTPIPAFADALSRLLQRTVVDKTGLTGNYDFQIRWRVDTPDAPDVQADANLPTVFGAVEEQLGLHLQPSKEPVPTLVIDHVELPSQN